MSRHPDVPSVFTSVTAAGRGWADLHVSVAALLTAAHSLNVSLSPVLDDELSALAHVDQHYLRPDTYAAADAVLIDARADIALAQAWDGGLVAAVDGVRFVVPVRSIDARPNPKYFARKKGVTWLNMISDQRIGLAGRVISGTPKDTLHFMDLVAGSGCPTSAAPGGHCGTSTRAAQRAGLIGPAAAVARSPRPGRGITGRTSLAVLSSRPLRRVRHPSETVRRRRVGWRLLS
ncbi:hypothetical protein FHR83_006188 [Actinoplanes campanulatus]|uniref:Tn3 transposase DDE domain-containing protein n=1 Tax=Actinoplanes campanulatus TaxID=113559 RepID=A0A7W5AMI1_9ACTN|nr:Tn3 family transposase [Actinoplanes campanulatus]MBB3098489.1 hypothetical protein [Actinoplanes campanulatus]GGN35502.1 hypothetical protein GCM10010109_59600 [Actinoplanes campanulatus]GID39183.1 hypothetical protein Aca09nite_56890 [Actinoplanes campanulatus]